MPSRIVRIVFALAVLATTLSCRPAAAQATRQGLRAQIQTERGCGPNAVYTVGDVLVVIFRIDGAQQAQATIAGVFPDGRSVTLYQAVVPGNTTISQPIANIGGTLGMRTVRLTASIQGGEITATADCAFTVAALQIKAQIATDRGCLENGDKPVYTIGEQMALLFRIDGVDQADASIQEILPNGQAQVIFHQIVPGNQSLKLPRDVVDPSGQRQVRLTAAALTGGATAQAQCGFTVAAAPLHIQRLLAVGDTVPAAGQLGIFESDPTDLDRNVSAIRRAADDGSLLIADYAGSALLRLGGGGPQVAIAPRHNASRLQSGSGSAQILLDTTSRDPVDGVGLARLLRVETGRDGTSAILALRADNNRGIYRLSNGVLSRLALLPGATGPAEFAIGDSGQIAYVAPTPTGVTSLVQVSISTPGTAPRTVPLLSQGQGVLNGAAIAGFSSLTSNGEGDLAVQLLLRRADGSSAQAVVRKTNAGLTLVAAAGQRVASQPGGNNPRPLIGMRQPRIGPDGTIVFLGTGDGFANFYVDGPNRSLQPMLPGSGWNPDAGTYDYAIAANGAVALRAASGQSTAPALFLSRPSGAAIQVVQAGGLMQPTGQPVFGPDGTDSLLFFLGRELDRPVDRNGHAPVVLSRSRLVNGSAVVVDSVAAPGQPVPGKRGAQLLTITQQPVVSATAVSFGALFGGTENFPVPRAGHFRVPLGGTLANATLVAEEGADLPGASRVAILRSLEYTADGTLLFRGLLPGAGSLVATLTAPRPVGTAARARTAAVARIQAGPPAVAPLLAIGQPLDRPDRLLLAVLSPFVALGTDRQLLVARFSLSDGSVGEGLFTVARTGQVQALAVTGDAAAAPPGARFAGFADTSAYTLNPPAVSADGSVVFKAKLDQAGTPNFGVFQWNGTAITNVGLTDPNPDNLALTPVDQPPYDLHHWSAGPGGSAYLMERHQTLTNVPVARLFEHFPTGLAPLVVPGLTPVTGQVVGPLAALSDYVVDSTGSVFVQGAAAGSQEVLALRPAGLAPVVTQGQPIPAPLDGTNVRGLVFGGSFTLMPDTARGVLLFRGGVTPQGTSGSGQQGLFRLSPQGVQTLMVESLAVGGSRDLTYGTLATTPDRQTVNGISAFATFGSGRWTIFRWRAGQTTVVAQEGGSLPGGGHVASLDPGPVLDLAPGAGPVFTLNNAGDVAFLASDGTRWGIYLFSDTGP